MAPRSERVLLTGGDGFTGAPLAQALRDDGHDVITVGRDAGVCDYAAELLEPEPIADLVERIRPTAIVHLAAIASTVDDNLHALYTINVAGTAALLGAARRSKAALSSIILASSAKVYAPPVSDAPMDETAPLGPFDHYGASKLAMEHVARLFAPDLPITVVRPFNYTGPGQDARSFFAPKIVSAFVRGESLRVGNLDVARDFSDVSSVVEAYRRLVAAPQPGQTFNMCSGQAVVLTELVRLAREVSGNDVAISVDPRFVRADEPKTIVGSSAKLEAAIGVLPRPALRETIERMVQSMASAR